MSDNVVHVQPKQHKFNYKRHNVVITFVPETKQWYWEFSYLVQRTLHGWADSINKAEKDARKWVDEIAEKTTTV